MRTGGSALRVVIVGQEYGSQAERIGLFTRRQEILTGYGRDRHYYKVDGFQGRNPHMRGTTSALRLLFGCDVGADRDGEFLDLASGERVHLFDAFALVNALLCGAHRPGTVSGSSTQVMREHCHWRAATDADVPTWANVGFAVCVFRPREAPAVRSG